MNAVLFSNRGTLDPRSISTFGVNSKDSENPIGYFGTGLKYAIAVLLRTKHEVTILSGAERYAFTTRREKIRNDEFDVVYMNDEPMAFTTELGKNWQLWAAFRELYCNAKDEGGVCSLIPEDTALNMRADVVNVIVKGQEFEKIYHDREEYFPDFTAMGENFSTVEHLQIFHKPSKYVYLRGIRVSELHRPARFTYNLLKGASLSEDRTLLNTWELPGKISRAVGGSTNKKFLENFLISEQPDYEREDVGTYWGQLSNEFVDVVRDHRHTPGLNQSAKTMVESQLGAALYAQSKVDLLPHEQRTLNKAHQLIEKIMAKIKYPVYVSEEMPSHLLGFALMDTKEIWLNRALLAQGVNRVASTLFEENAHLALGMTDCTREFQNHILDTLFGVVEAL